MVNALIGKKVKQAIVFSQKLNEAYRTRGHRIKLILADQNGKW